MTATKVQIEAAAKAMCLVQFGDEFWHGDSRCCQTGGTNGCCVETLNESAERALAAAEGVKTMTVCDDYHVRRSKTFRMLEAVIDAKDQRIQDLLEANNEYLERARSAENTVKHLRDACAAAMLEQVNENHVVFIKDFLVQNGHLRVE